LIIDHAVLVSASGAQTIHYQFIINNNQKTENYFFLIRKNRKLKEKKQSTICYKNVFGETTTNIILSNTYCIEKHFGLMARVNGKIGMHQLR